MRPGPLKVAESRWLTPTGKRQPARGDKLRAPRRGGFGALDRELRDAEKLRGKLASYRVTVRQRDVRGRFVTIHKGKRTGIPAIENATELRMEVEKRVRREVFGADKVHAKKYPERPNADASAAQWKRFKAQLKSYKASVGLQFKVEVFREVTGGTSAAPKRKKKDDAAGF